MKRTISIICATMILGTSLVSAQNLNLWVTSEGSGVSFNTGVPLYYPAPVTYFDGPVIVNGHHHHYRGHKYKTRNKKMRKDLKKMRKARKKYYKAQRDYYRHAYDRHGYRHHHHDDDDDDD